VTAADCVASEDADHEPSPPAREQGCNETQPHEPDRDKRQPYGKEDEDYSGAGVVRPPEEKVGKRDEPNPRKP
jgi:hypothetical protein